MSQKKSGIVTITGRTWGDFPLEIYIYEGGNVVEKFTTTSSDKGEYEVSWVPQKTGKFIVRSIFKVEEAELQKEKEFIVDDISPHFYAPLSV